MAPEHDKAGGNWRREKETRRSPDRRPKRRRDDDRQWRHARRVAEELGLDDLPHDPFEDDKQQSCLDDHAPTGVDGGGER
jgi:hypothetical protein